MTTRCESQRRVTDNKKNKLTEPSFSKIFGSNNKLASYLEPGIGLREDRSQPGRLVGTLHGGQQAETRADTTTITTIRSLTKHNNKNLTKI